jgi:hypothetical protein
MREPCSTCGKTGCAHQPELPLISPAANLIEFREIQKFTAACRQLWLGAKVGSYGSARRLCCGQVPISRIRANVRRTNRQP